MFSEGAIVCSEEALEGVFRGGKSVLRGALEGVFRGDNRGCFQGAIEGVFRGGNIVCFQRGQ